MNESPSEENKLDWTIEPLKLWQRILAGFVSLAAAGVGGFAVFTSANQAGTTMLLTITLLFGLIGLQGTALRKFGLGANGSNMELEGVRAKKMLEEAEREPDPAVAQQIEKAASIIAPEVARPRLAAGSAFEVEVLESLRAEADLQLRLPVSSVGWPDAIATDLRGVEVALEVRYLHSRSFGMADLRRTQTRSGQGPTVIITNAPLLREVIRWNFGGEAPIEVITWTGPQVVPLIHRAILRVARFGGAGDSEN